MISPRASSEAAGQSNPGYREARIVRLLFVGGCHTVGYPFGPEHGFPRLACEELQRQHARTAIECEVLPYVSLRRADVILEKCRAVRPDILVLQLGHYETEAVLKSRLWALISRRRPARESASSSSSLSSSAASSSPWTRHAASFSSAAPSFAATSSTRVSTEIDHPEGGRSRWPTPRRIAKYWTDLLLCAAGLPVVNLNEVRRQAEELFTRLRGEPIPHIVILSPFLTLQAVTNRYRRNVGRVLREEAARAGFPYLDLDPVFGGPCSRRRQALHWNIVHLNECGERHVGAALAGHLEALLAGESKPSAAPSLREGQAAELAR